MIWLIMGEESHQIVSCNKAKDEDKYQLWVTRPNGKNLKVYESLIQGEVKELKEAIDFAISSGSRTFTM